MVQEPLKFCTVCASNNNRSMEAHRVLRDAGFDVNSYGTGSMVRLPGASIDSPVVYGFGTSYDYMYNDLKQKNERMYTANGVLNMLDRNRHIKDHPEKWHENDGKIFDIVFTCEERCFDSVCVDLLDRGGKYNRLLHVINVEIRDNHAEAKNGGEGILELAKNLNSCTDLDSQILDVMAKWQEKRPGYPLMYQACFY